MADREQVPSKVTAQEVVDRYRDGEATPIRLQKARELAKRSRIPWSDVQIILDRG